MTDLTSSPQNQTIVETAAPHRRNGILARVLIIAAALLLAALAIHLTPVRDWLSDAHRVRQMLFGLGAWVYPVTIIAVALLVTCGVPRLLFCALGGAIFGFWIGLLLIQIGTVLGQYSTFAFIRWGGRDWVLNRWPKLGKWAAMIHDHGVIGVILLRQLPAHSMLTNFCLGLSHVKHRQFLIGTAIGLLPEAIPATLIGAGLVKATLRDSIGHLAIAAAAFAVIWIGCAYVIRSMRASRAGAEIVAEAEALKEAEG